MYFVVTCGVVVGIILLGGWMSMMDLRKHGTELSDEETLSLVSYSMDPRWDLGDLE